MEKLDERAAITSKSLTFFHLPAELRNKIYSLVLSENATVHLVPGFDRSALSILRTCKGVFNEAVGIYYSANQFVFCVTEGTCVPSLPGFVRQVATPRWSALESLKLVGSPKPEHFIECLQVFGDLQNLRSLDLYMEYVDYSEMQHYVLPEHFCKMQLRIARLKTLCHFEVRWSLAREFKELEALIEDGLRAALANGKV